MSNVNWAASDHLPWRTAEWVIGGTTERATRVRGQNRARIGAPWVSM